MSYVSDSFKYIKALEGIKESEWLNLRGIINASFELEKRKPENDLELSDHETIKNVIWSQFGQKLD